MPMPVFPDVGSINVSPFFILPDFSADDTIAYPMRSFTDPPGFKNSHFAYKLQGKSAPTRFNFTVGVFPIASKILFNNMAPPLSKTDPIEKYFQSQEVMRIFVSAGYRDMYIQKHGISISSNSLIVSLLTSIT